MGTAEVDLEVMIDPCPSPDLAGGKVGTGGLVAGCGKQLGGFSKS